MTVAGLLRNRILHAYTLVKPLRYACMPARRLWPLLSFEESSVQRPSSRTSANAERCWLLHHTQVKGQVLLLGGSEAFSIMDEA